MCFICVLYVFYMCFICVLKKILTKLIHASTVWHSRQPDGKGSHGRCGGPAFENIHALTWPTFAFRRNRQLGGSASTVFWRPGRPGGNDSWAARRQGSHGRCGGPALENIHALTWPTFATRRFRRLGGPAETTARQHWWQRKSWEILRLCA